MHGISLRGKENLHSIHPQWTKSYKLTKKKEIPSLQGHLYLADDQIVSPSCYLLHFLDKRKGRKEKQDFISQFFGKKTLVRTFKSGSINNATQKMLTSKDQ